MKRSFVVFLAGGAVIAAIVFSVFFGVRKAVEHAVLADAIDKTQQWAEFMERNVPDLDMLPFTGIPNKEQHETINAIRSYGEVFRFKLFTNDGRLALVSDDAGNRKYRGSVLEADPQARMVIESKQPIVEVFSGIGKADRPDLYAEAYLPLIYKHGEVYGVVEVYVDQTATNQQFIASFRLFGFAIATLCALIFAVPALAFYVQRGIAQRSRRNAENLARFDPLTGLMNRREFREQAYALGGSNASVAFLCYLDLDNFKTINDTKGHAVGDAFLKHIAQIIKAHCGSNDLAARFGGDEFVIGFFDPSQAAVIQQVKALLKACSTEFNSSQDVISGSVSIGIAQVEHGQPIEDALRNADAALYFAKASGGNDFAVYGSEMGEEIERRRQLEMRLHDATKGEEFYIHYQPLVSSVDRSVLGYEALLRLKNKDGENIPPAVFIPIAEELGLIDEIGKWTMRTAIEEISRVSNHVKVAVNLSAAQFKAGTLADTVAKMLKETGFDPARLELEVTESLLLDDSTFVEVQIDNLKELGIQIAMDDFGTGFSSLSYLWKYGFDRLKIDRSFVLALDQNPEKSREIIEAIIMLGMKLNMKITAEGVETHEQSELLSALGCDTLQGFFFGRPSRLESFENHDMDGSKDEESRRSG